jgi:hypothetical protein
VDDSHLLGQHLLNIAVTQSEPSIEPNQMADNFRRKALTLERELTHRLSLMSAAQPAGPVDVTMLS